jgi:hypothetical protein
LGTRHLHWILIGPLFAVWPLPYFCDFAHVGVLFASTYSNISSAAKAGFPEACSLAAPRQGRRYAVLGQFSSASVGIPAGEIKDASLHPFPHRLNMEVDLQSFIWAPCQVMCTAVLLG